MNETESTFDYKANVITLLNAAIKNLPHRQRKLCEYILNNYQEVAFYTIETLASASNTSQSTVVRTIRALGYDNYRDLQKDIHKIVIANNISVWWELQRSLDEPNEGDFNESTFTRTAKDNVEAIQNTTTPQLLKNFVVATDLLAKARKIGVFGTRSTKAVAFYLYFMLQQLSNNALLLDAIGADQIYDELLNFSRDDVFVALSLGGPHFTKRTIDAVEFAYKNDIPTILITNDLVNPAFQYATVILQTASTQLHYSIVPPITLIEALVVAFGKCRTDTSRQKIHQIDKALTEQNITK